MANDGMLRVNFNDLQQAAVDIRAAVSALQTDLDELERAGGQLQENWSGEAKQAYAERQATWQTATASLQTILQEIERAVGDSRDDYLATEKQATQRFQ